MTAVYNSWEQGWVGFISHYCVLGPLIEESNGKATKSPPKSLMALVIWKLLSSSLGIWELPIAGNLEQAWDFIC